MKIKAIMDTLVSKPDRAGGSYTAFRYTVTETGRQVTGLVGRGCESNVNWALGLKGLCDAQNVYRTTHELSIRDWNRVTSDFVYSGSHPEAIAEFIQKELRRTVKVDVYEPPTA